MAEIERPKHPGVVTSAIITIRNVEYYSNPKKVYGEYRIEFEPAPDDDLLWLYTVADGVGLPDGASASRMVPSGSFSLEARFSHGNWGGGGLSADVFLLLATNVAGVIQGAIATTTIGEVRSHILNAIKKRVSNVRHGEVTRELDENELVRIGNALIESTFGIPARSLNTRSTSTDHEKHYFALEAYVTNGSSYRVRFMQLGGETILIDSEQHRR